MCKTVFVFGSNEAGVHGAGAAKVAYKKHGARWGFSYGHMGDSFAIPTKDKKIETLPIERIKQYVQGFLAYAAGCPNICFQVTQIGCGLAGYRAHEIAPLFKEATENVEFDSAWGLYLPSHLKFWGTF